MVKDAEAHADEDKKRRELVEAKNNGEALIHAAEKSLSEAGDKIGSAEKQAVESAVAELKTALQGTDPAAIKSKAETLSQATMKIGEALYKAQQSAEAAGAAPGGGAGAGAEKPAGDDKVVDADFEEVDEQKKRGQG